MITASSPPAPTPVSPSVSAATTILETIIDDGIVKGLLEPYAVSVFPVLGIPIVSNLFDFAIEEEGDYIATNLAQILAAGIISIQVNQENSAFSSAWTALNQALASGDPNAIAAATTTLKTTFNTLVGWDGS